MKDMGFEQLGFLCSHLSPPHPCFFLLFFSVPTPSTIFICILEGFSHGASLRTEMFP